MVALVDAILQKNSLQSCCAQKRNTGATFPGDNLVFAGGEATPRKSLSVLSGRCDTGHNNSLLHFSTNSAVHGLSSNSNFAPGEGDGRPLDSIGFQLAHAVDKNTQRFVSGVTRTGATK